MVYLEGTEGNPPAVRETTEQEHLIATFRRYERLSENWDGEGAAAPIIASLRAAGDFVCQLGPSVEIPAAMLHSTGHAGLAWSGDRLDGEIEFLDTGAIAYYFSDGKDKHTGVVAPDSKAIPKVLEVLLPTV